MLFMVSFLMVCGGRVKHENISGQTVTKYRN